MKKSYFLGVLFIVLNSTLSLHSQDHLFELGTVITPTDTFKGFLKRATEMSLTNSVEFKTDSNSTVVKVFKPESTSSFTFDSDKTTFGKVQIGFSKNEKYQSEWRFGRLLLKGATSVYKLTLSSADKHIILDERCKNLYIVLKKGVFYTLELKETLEENMYKLKKRYIPILQYITRDCPKISRNTEGVAFEDKAIVDYFNQYNNCINPEEKTIVYKPKFKTIIGHGIEASTTFKPTRVSAFGYFVDAREPHLSERLHATVGLNFMRFSSQNSHATGLRLKVIGNYDLVFKKSRQLYFGCGYEFVYTFSRLEVTNGALAKNETFGLFCANLGYRLQNVRFELGSEYYLGDVKFSYYNLTLGWYFFNNL